jgi:hypothetical protein
VFNDVKLNSNNMKKNLLCLLIAGILSFMHASVCSQGITTSSLEGSVLKMTSDPLSDANVVVVHEPSGTSYGTITRPDGRFNLPNIRTGGPYKITITHMGYDPDVTQNIYFKLGENKDLIFIMLESGTTLSELTVTARKDFLLDGDRTGAATNLSRQTIDRMPSISRSINDLTKMSPQSNGVSFAGRDNRFNNYTIDGITYNNNFGLGTGQSSGSDPISIDVIEEVQVNIAPYDVREGNFTGANVNAITRSGGNIFTASAYAYYKNERLIGNKIDDKILNVSESFKKIFGARIGGPIVKDMLSFFVSLESEENSVPGLSKVAARPGLNPDGVNVSRVTAERLDFVKEQIQTLYGYDPGDYEGYKTLDKGIRLNARLDYNISSKHKAMIRLNSYVAATDEIVNGNSLRYNPSALRYQNTNRYGIEAMNFTNSHYSVDKNVTSIVGEVNSIISTEMANNFRIGFNMITDPIRKIPGGQKFPFIEVLEFDGTTPLYYMTLGNELYSVGNQLINNIFSVTDNFSYYMGKHAFTAGFSFESMTFENAFNPALHGVYRFNSYDDFVAAVINQDINVRPALFLQGYSYKGKGDIPVDETKFGQFAIYIQDKFKFDEKLTITAGLRVDLPFYPIDLPNNPVLDTMTFNGAPLSFVNPLNYETITPDVSVLPGIKPLWSPRVGFNYDVFGDRKLQVRGGSGLFSGRIPFVWISNQVNNNGVTRGGFGYTPTQWGTSGRPTWDGFQSDVTYYQPDPSNLTAQVSSGLAITDPNFKLPQVWRSNLAADIELPYGIVATVEGIFSKDYNSPLAVNINTNAPTDTIQMPNGYQLPYWTNANAYVTNPRFSGGVILLTNTNIGYYASGTIQLTKNFKDENSMGFAYTRSISKDYGLIGGSQAASLWPDVVAWDRNKPEVGFARFDKPHRVVAHATLNTKVLSDKNTMLISVFYDGAHGGRFSYTYSGRFNDGAARLMYIPSTFEESYLIDKTVAGEVITAAQQWEILNKYIEQDKYLNKNRGKVAERNGALLPWVNRLDLRIAQDIDITRKGDHRLRIHFDILNLGNMLNKKWGVAQTFTQRNLMNFEGIDTNGNPRFTVNTMSGTTEFPTESYRNIIDISQTWSAQIGIRYLFN